MYVTQLRSIEGDDYQVHQYVRKLFAEEQKVLFQRMDDCILVLSEKKSPEVAPMKEDDFSSFTNESMHPFTIRLNPSQRRRKSHKRFSIDPRFIKKWITKKLFEAGVEARFQYINEGMRQCMKKDGVPISLVSVLCFGTLVVKNEEVFRKALREGIGKGKGFGYGLINTFC